MILATRLLLSCLVAVWIAGCAAPPEPEQPAAAAPLEAASSKSESAPESAAPPAPPLEPVSGEPEPELERPPNILLITIDTQRADSFGMYGNPGGHTPHIDALAERGVVFDRATAPIGTTFPSHATLLTGLYPRRHGLRYNGDTLEEEMVTLTEILRENGWDTMALVTYGSMVSRGGLGQGFVRTSHEKNGERSISAAASRVGTMARGLLKRRRPFPFFMWVHYFQPHSPYELTPYAEEQLAGYDGPLAKGATVEEFYALGKKKWRDEDRAALRVLYDGETRSADAAVGSILETLEQAGHAERTIVVVTSDHGQLLGEHRAVGHGARLWEPVLHVPLVIFDPRRPDARRVSSRVGLVDVTPTLLEMVGLPAPEGIDGRSLVPGLRGEKLEERPYYSEVRGLKNGKSKRDPNALAVYLGDRKLVVRKGKSRHYDLAEDPSERSPIRDVAEDPQAQKLAELAAAYGAPGDATGGQVAPKDLAPHVREELRALGYVQ
ncbi:MAG: sulfatase [Candidatus Binatia bacterium]|nr:sulfatase [Candidatus Binatia bacterium]